MSHDQLAMGDTKEGCLRVVRQNGQRLYYASEEFKNDREVVMAAINQSGFALQHASAALQADRELVLAALTQDGYALQYASVALRADREVVLVALLEEGCALQYASAALQVDREMVLAAIDQNPWTLKYISAAFTDDPEVVLAAVNKGGRVLQFASAAVKDNREVVMVAVAQDYNWSLSHPEFAHEFAIRQASPALQAEFEGDGILTYVREQLQLRSSFFGPFLCAIALPAPEAAAAAAPGGARCLLPKLDIGEEKPIQQLTAAFSGVPIGSSWRFVQLAAAHLATHL